jgi:hypothetical protein
VDVECYEQSASHNAIARLRHDSDHMSSQQLELASQVHVWIDVESQLSAPQQVPPNAAFWMMSS